VSNPPILTGDDKTTVTARCNAPSRFPKAAADGGVCGFQVRADSWQEAHARFSEHVRINHAPAEVSR
jgi:hypothetical protein